MVVLGELDVDQAESRAQARVIAEKIRASLAVTYFLNCSKEREKDITVEHHCSASSGVVVFVNQETLHADSLRWADAAMYQAKQSGRANFRFFNSMACDSKGGDAPLTKDGLPT